MSLGKLQESFAVAQARLILFLKRREIGVREKSGVRCDNCHVGKVDSVHKVGLAKDFRLTIKGKLVEDVYPKKWERVYNMAHDKWDELGGAPRIAGDLGHFSFKYQGRW